MNEKRISDLYTILKRTDKTMLFQFTRSSDKRVIKCKAMFNDEGKLARGVARIIEYNLETNQELNVPFQDDIIDHFFSFTQPLLSSDGKNDPGAFHTTCKALPGRDILVHTLAAKYFMTTTIAGIPDTSVIGVHVTIDTPANSLPLLRAITMYGYNKAQKKMIQENLSVSSYLSEFAKLMMART